MANEHPSLPNPEVMKRHALASLSRYWEKGVEHVASLPVTVSGNSTVQIPLVLCSINMPSWAKECGIGGAILVPVESTNLGNQWNQVDWWLAIFLLLECWHERLNEQKKGKPIHSYSTRLKNWDTRAWDAAWVNRIALFMRKWIEQIRDGKVDDLIGPAPNPTIYLTHDVDAVKKTLPIRLKQCAFNGFNAIRNMARCNVIGVFSNVCSSFRFLFRSDDWWTFDRLLELEKNKELNVQFNFYSDRRKKTLKSWLFDPEYDSSSLKLKKLFVKIKNQGYSIGLHPTFDAWENQGRIKQQKDQLEEDAETGVVACRQHWLRFSWRSTWSAQEKAGIKQDSTLMFNNRPGFRSSAAMIWSPWNAADDEAHSIKELPTMLMDAHFYDYCNTNDLNLKSEIKKWVQECIVVGGEIAVLWHPHTLSKDYDWNYGFKILIDEMAHINND